MRMAGTGMAAGAALALLMTCAVGRLGAAPTAPPPAADPELTPERLRPLIAPYMDARARGALGDVAGDASEDVRSPASPSQPVVGVSVMLLPRFAGLDARLDQVKESARVSPSSYAESGERLSGIRADYERALGLAGGGELVLGEVTDAQGRFRFSGVPAGSWVLLAWHEAPHAKTGRKLKRGDSTTFRGNMEHIGYVAVTIWRMEVEVRAGEPAAVSLHDRNGWFTAVKETQRLPTDAAPNPRRRR